MLRQLINQRKLIAVTATNHATNFVRRTSLSLKTFPTEQAILKPEVRWNHVGTLSLTNHTFQAAGGGKKWSIT